MSTTRRTTVATLAALTAAGALAATPAGADLVVQQSLAGISPGMTRAQVEAVLGAPQRVTTRPDDIMGSYDELRYGLTTVSISGGEEGSVFSISTTSKKQRTSSGVGVGTTEKTLRRKVRGLRCSTYAGRFRICMVGRLTPGQTVTDFRIGKTSKKVVSIQLGLVID
ncbi:hypothetical protein GKE82_02060 [Conexibacter sp. W3-3-2]|uniref:hypothetical protein n=1 Tax=Conexibacter sp. W3-3-2 TaxID=2675227 RepID=UPI0012B96B46|nr:hypothetical protein [Conexibacter sp. W3-3-2]MTD43120.1 hypothetical protein [Conexibacter sp. W3-3-2]